MRFDLDKVFGIHEQGVRIRERRAELLAGNLANADTPNYKARDIDFKQVLQQAEAGTNTTQMKITNAKHLQTDGFAGFARRWWLASPLQTDATSPNAAVAQSAIPFASCDVR